MNKKFFILCMSIMCCICFASCNKKELVNDSNQISSNAIENFENDNNEKTSYDTYDLSYKENDEVLISVIINCEKLDEKAKSNKFVVEKMDEIVKEYKLYAKSFIDQNLNEARTLKEETGMEGMELETSISLAYMDENVASFIANIYEYYGGAHGSTVIVPFNIDVKLGREIKLNEIVKNKDAFYDEIQNCIENKYKDELFDDYKETLIKYRSGEYDTDWYYKTGGICVYFGQYALAPYASGILDVFIPYEKLN